LEKPWIKKKFIDKVNKILEHNHVHYFYWPLEIGFNRKGIKLGKIAVPTFPKRHDYEPVKVTNYNGKVVVLSRFHYDLLTYFNKPLIQKGRTVIKFLFGGHTPFAYTDLKCQLNFGFNGSFPPNVDSRIISGFRRLLGYFEAFCAGNITYDEDELQELVDYDVRVERPPDEVLFVPEKMYAIMWLGTYPSPAELQEIGYKAL
jgi:hypothetical protein